MYRYYLLNGNKYIPYDSDTHYLYSTEMAKVCGIVSNADVPHSRLISSWLKKRSSQVHDIHGEKPSCYYLWRGKYIPVFHPMMIYDIMKNFESYPSFKSCIYRIDGRDYVFKRVKDY